MASEFERVLCVKNEIFVFRIPPRQSNRGYRAADWKLDEPDWTGRMRIITKGKDLIIKLEDKNSGELFAECPVNEYPGSAVEAVLDSSRYFVLRIVDGNGRSAFIGMGFTDRADSFDLNVSIQDHFKWLRQEDELEKAPATKFDSGPKLDLGFKEGQTITLNLGNMKEGASKPRPKPQMGGTPGILPPPPAGGVKLPPPPSSSSSSTASPKHRNTNNNQPQQLVSLSSSSSSSSSAAPAPAPSINNQMTQNIPPTTTTTSQKPASNDFNMLIDLGSSVPEMSSMPPPMLPMNGSSQQTQQVPDLFGEFKTAESTTTANSAQSDPWLQF